LGNYQTYAKRYFLASNLCGAGVREIKLKHLQKFYENLPVSTKYRKNVMDALYTLFRWLKRWGEISEVPTWPELDEVIEKQGFALTREEQDQALSNLPPEHLDIIEFMMETGLRRSKACALMLVDVDPGRKRALIRRTYSEAQLRNKTKQKREYWLTLSDRAWELVEKNIQVDFPFVFRNPITKRGYRYKFVYRVWKTYSGFQLDLYEARHSFCTQIVEDGASSMHAQYLMRHADQRSTKRYLHPTDDKTRELLNRRGLRKVISIDEAKRK